MSCKTEIQRQQPSTHCHQKSWENSRIHSSKPFFTINCHVRIHKFSQENEAGKGGLRDNCVWHGGEGSFKAYLWEYIWILWFKKGEGVLFIVLDPLFQIRACQHKTYNCLSNSRYEKLWNYICTCLIEVLQEIYYIFIIIKIQIKLVNEHFTE